MDREAEEGVRDEGGPRDGDEAPRDSDGEPTGPSTSGDDRISAMAASVLSTDTSLACVGERATGEDEELIFEERGGAERG